MRADVSSSSRRLAIPEIHLTLRIPSWNCGESVPTGVIVATGFVTFNLLLFVPLYLIVADENNFWPFFPLGHPRGPYDWSWPGLGRSTYEYVMQLLVRRHNKDLFRISADWVLILSSLILAGRFASRRWRRALVWLASLAYAALLAFMAYSGFSHVLFDRPGTLLDDVLMVGSAWVFVRDTWGPTDILAAVALVGAAGAGGMLVARYLAAACRWGGGLGARPVVGGWLAVNAYCLLSLSWFGIARDDPIIQLQAKHVYQNWQRSQDVLATVRTLNGSVVRAAANLAETIPVRRPDIFLFSVESYGAALWADADYRVARRGLMRHVRGELGRAGAPDANALRHGSGARRRLLDEHGIGAERDRDHQPFNVLAWRRMADRYPHLISYLEGEGYYTLAVQPGATWVEDLYGYDEVIIRQDFSYDGPFYGFGHVPDQWALEYAFANHWIRKPRPRLLHFFSVSTHFAWEPPPRIVEDIAALEEPQPSFLETQPEYVELALTVPQGWKRDYFVTVAYEWELMLDVFRQRAEPEFIALIVGDHQPPFITDGLGGDDVALHVVTDIPQLSRALESTGFATGRGVAWDGPVAEAFRMEALYPFLLSLLSAEHGVRCSTVRQASRSRHFRLGSATLGAWQACPVADARQASHGQATCTPAALDPDRACAGGLRQIQPGHYLYLHTDDTPGVFEMFGTSLRARRRPPADTAPIAGIAGGAAPSTRSGPGGIHVGRVNRRTDAGLNTGTRSPRRTIHWPGVRDFVDPHANLMVGPGDANDVAAQVGESLDPPRPR